MCLGGFHLTFEKQIVQLYTVPKVCFYVGLIILIVIVLYRAFAIVGVCSANIRHTIVELSRHTFAEN